ncbi:MAG: HNH endonuclease [Patescibacteria group bacterium]|nr:HNH endonuclease [Patescibacteria group bacterium]
MRRGFPDKIKIAAFKRCDGRCESCTAKLYPGKYEYDHTNPDALTGEPVLDNCAVLCRACHAAKTKGDVKRIAKAKRVERKHHGVRRVRTITTWRRFDGTAVRAPRER